MLVEIKIPSPGESVTMVEIARWMVKEGETVEKDQEIGEIESEKATLPIIAPESGQVRILVEAGTTVPVGTVVATIDPSAPIQLKKQSKIPKTQASAGNDPESKEKTGPLAGDEPHHQPNKNAQEPAKIVITPLARKKMEAHGMDEKEVMAGLLRITSDKVEQAVDQKVHPTSSNKGSDERSEQRIRMSQLRKKLSERLVAARNQTAMLTTFNEADMSSLMELREKYQSQFVEKYGVRISYLSFFTKAATVALQEFRMINALVEGDEIVLANYCDIGIAVQTEKGLMVPVVRNAHRMNIPELERHIHALAEKARNFKLSMDEMTGGTFTITDGGVFGSLFSTPLLNPPQSAILGMHSIVKRPVVVNDVVVVRPMMYLALSYDHRIVDGKESVQFLLRIKNLIENPLQLLAGGKNPAEILLGL